MYRPLYWYGNNYRPTIDYNYSIGQTPQFSDGGKTVTIKLNSWKWSDGEPVSSRDLVFWMNVMKASPATEWCGYVPGYFPDNVSGYRRRIRRRSSCTSRSHTTLRGSYCSAALAAGATPAVVGPDFVVSRRAADIYHGHLPDTTKAGAAAVYKFLDAQANSPGSWSSSPLWSVVDGPFKLQSFTSAGQATLVPNPDYSGSPKATISKLVLLRSRARPRSTTRNARVVRARSRSGSFRRSMPRRHRRLRRRATPTARRRATRSTTSR